LSFVENPHLDFCYYRNPLLMILEICKLKLYFINIPTLYNGEKNITGRENNYED